MRIEVNFLEESDRRARVLPQGGAWQSLRPSKIHCNSLEEITSSGTVKHTATLDEFHIDILGAIRWTQFDHYTVLKFHWLTAMMQVVTRRVCLLWQSLKILSRRWSYRTRDESVSFDCSLARRKVKWFRSARRWFLAGTRDAGVGLPTRKFFLLVSLDDPNMIKIVDRQ